MAEEPTPRTLARRLRAAARPSLGLALTALGVMVGLGAVLMERNRNDRSEQPQVRVCRSESLRATVRRQVRAQETYVARRPITSRASVTATEAGADGGRVSVTATASGGRILVVRASVTATGAGQVTLRESARGCAFHADRKEAGFRAGVEAKRRAQRTAERRGAPLAGRRAREDARRRGQADARRRAQAKLDRSEPGEQTDLDQATREKAQRQARQQARQKAAAT